MERRCRVDVLAEKEIGAEGGAAKSLHSEQELSAAPNKWIFIFFFPPPPSLI